MRIGERWHVTTAHPQYQIVIAAQELKKNTLPLQQACKRDS
jgi:hypothetical protein